MGVDGARLEARGINAWRGDRHVLRDVSFRLQGGEMLKVTGPNGVGKTTLLRVVGGLLPPESGEIEWCGQSSRRARDEFNAELGYLGHVNALKPDLTAHENLRFLAGLRQTVSGEEIDAVLDRVGLSSRAKLPARALSAGQKRRLALARLELAGASLWILDEPATNLDRAGLHLVEELISGHVRRGGLAIAAAHQALLNEAPYVRQLELTP
jgi:heme exporter protein A